MTNKQEVLRELLIDAGWVSAQHVDKLMLVFDVDIKSVTTSVLPPPASASGGRGGDKSTYSRSKNNNPVILACMDAIRDWVRVNHQYIGGSTDLAKMLKETGVKIGSMLARQIVSDAGLEWPDGYKWDRYRFDPRGGLVGEPRASSLLIDDPAVARAYSLLMEALGVSTKQETYRLGSEEVRAYIEIPPGTEWSKNQGFRRKKSANYQDTQEEVASPRFTVEADNGGSFHSALIGKGI